MGEKMPTKMPKKMAEKRIAKKTQEKVEKKIVKTISKPKRKLKKGLSLQKKSAPRRTSRSPSAELPVWNRKAARALADLIDFALHFPELRKRGPQGLEWNAGVRIVLDAEMKQLNFRYRGKRSTTDVLSFGAAEPFRSLGYLGELVVSLPVMKRQAREQQHSTEAELWILLSHGLLHLLGMDHEQSAQSEREQRLWEARLLAFTDLSHDRGLVERASRR
jgi:rRNA maturation RNase YbeY